MEGLHVFLFFQIPGKKGFKFHAQPQTGAYSCFQSLAKASPQLMKLLGLRFKEAWARGFIAGFTAQLRPHLTAH